MSNAQTQTQVIVDDASGKAAVEETKIVISTRVTPGSDREAELVEHYLPLVRAIVNRLAASLPSHVDVDNLRSVGMIGLMNALRNYDPEGGSSFESYARVRVRGALLDELRKIDWVPRSVHSKNRKVQAVVQELEQELGRVPKNSEIARRLGISDDEYDTLQEEIKPATFVCLDAPMSSDNDDSPSHYESLADDNQTSPFDETHRGEVIELIGEKLKQLPDMQRKVLMLYYYEDLRLREIADIFGLTESRICQIHAQAILSIKNYLERKDG